MNLTVELEVKQLNDEDDLEVEDETVTQLVEPMQQIIEDEVLKDDKLAQRVEESVQKWYETG